MSRRITAAVLTWNRRDCVVDTVTLLSKHREMEVIVVDNASTDGTAEALRSAFPALKVVTLRANVGVSGWNAALREAKTPYVLLLDDDSAPTGDGAARGADFLDRHPRVGGIAYRIRNLDGRTEPIAHFRRPSASYSETSHFIGCGFLLRRSVLERTHGFDERIFIYQHELDFALAMLRHRWRIAFLPQLEVLHRLSGVHRTTYRKAYFGTRNTIWTLFKHLPRSQAAARVIPIVAVHGTKYLMEMRRFPSIRPIAGVLRGAFDALRNLPEPPVYQSRFERGRVLRDPMVREPFRTAIARVRLGEGAGYPSRRGKREWLLS